MKLLILFLLSSNIAWATSISGVVKVKGNIPSGTLYIFAKKYNGKMPMPLAVKKIESPKYPYKFTLDESDQMMKGMPFKGPFTVVARISPSGNAMDKSGIESTTDKPINSGDDVEIILKK